MEREKRSTLPIYNKPRAAAATAFISDRDRDYVYVAPPGPPPPPPPLGYRPNIALFSRIDTCRGFSYTVFRDCVYMHAHTHTRHTPDAVRFFFSSPPRAPILPACVRACTAYILYTPRPDGRHSRAMG